MAAPAIPLRRVSFSPALVQIEQPDRRMTAYNMQSPMRRAKRTEVVDEQDGGPSTRLNVEATAVPRRSLRKQSIAESATESMRGTFPNTSSKKKAAATIKRGKSQRTRSWMDTEDSEKDVAEANNLGATFW